ncbi:MAG: SDR family oxidoreductase [Cyanobacteria bacterium P01_G01_bin.67]
MDKWEKEDSLESIAIIGMAGRFPGAKNIDEFWQNLHDGVESISFFTDDELINMGIDSAMLSNPKYVKAGGVLSDVELFDASFFNFARPEAEVTDPQHRLFLECAWSALENAGYDSETYTGRIGVYAGAGMNSYLLNNLSVNPEAADLTDFFQLFIGNDKDFVTTKASFHLNLTGPSVNVNTACSTSLVAVHLSCQSLLNYQCDVVLAGGVSVNVPQKSGYLYQDGMIMSPDGHCRAFDAQAEGTILGRGLGIVVLKRLEDALADGDYIHAVIKGSAINNDGSVKAGYTAPSINGQAAVILEAQALAGIDSDTITYIEAHGSGTPLGDPIEIAALTQAFSANTNKKGFCAVGSVKTNIGHLDSAAGIAGLIKTVLALRNKQIPPSLNFNDPNPKIDFANSPFYVNNKLTQWEANDTPRRAGVSSFGIGGTNAHVVLEEAPLLMNSVASRPWQLLILSAKTSSALEKATLNLAKHLEQNLELNLADVAYTLQLGRREFDYRRVVVCQDIKNGISALSDPKRVLTSIKEVNERPIAFMFTGLGTHYLNMALELYQLEPVFREQVDHCCEMLKPLLELDLRDIIYPNKSQVSESSPPTKLTTNTSQLSQSSLDLRKMLGRDQKSTDETTQQLNQTYLTQPAVFVIEYALAQLFISWGIRPVAMIGYSIGEYVAATLAGVLSLEDALTLVAKRAQMIQDLPSGSMLAVPLSEEEVRPLLGDKLSLSAINGAKLCVIAGDTDAVEELADQLTEQGLACRHLPTSHAFHSQMMEPIASPFTKLVKTVSLNPPQIPYLSNVTGTWITEAEATDPSYWIKHMCQAVRFAEGVNELWKQQKPILLEVGPGQTLSSFALQCLESEEVADKVVLPSLRDAFNQQPDLAFLLNTLGQLWLSGVEINWSKLYTDEHRHRIPLPTYPFERQRYWIEPRKPIAGEQVSLARKSDPADWFYIPSWKKSMPPVSFEAGSLAERKSCWLVFVDELGIGNQIIQQLENENQDVTRISKGEQFNKLSEREYIINYRLKSDYDNLLQDLHTQDRLPDNIVHLWSLRSNEQIQSSIEFFQDTQHTGFYSLLFLTQALSKQLIDDPIQIWLLSNNMHSVESTDVCHPEKSTLLGLGKVIPQEYSNITCQSIDVVLPKSEGCSEETLIDRLMSEITGKSFDLVIAYRGNQRWVQAFEAVRLDKLAEPPKRLRRNGIYLITGGLGGIGLTLAEYLAQTVQAKLVLLGRSGLPTKQKWGEWLSTHDTDNPTSIRIKKVQNLEKLGAEVLIVKADVTNEIQMQKALRRTEERFGQINGVIHAAASLGEEMRKTIQEAKYTECEQQFQPKVYGLYILEKVLQEKELDYCMLVSSVGAVLGGVAVAAYTAANIFVDGFAHKQNQIGNVNWFSANWFHAENADSIYKSLLSVAQGSQEQIEIQKQIEIETKGFQRETVDVFQRILSNPLVPQIIIWRNDITAEIDKWIKRKPQQDAEQITSQDQTYSTYTRPNLRTSYVAPSSETEQRIAKRYQKLLGIEQVGIHDSFFDLGGNSLIGTQMISQLRQDFNVEIPISILFEAPTVAELALTLEKIIIEKLESLTEEEAEELVSDISS